MTFEVRDGEAGMFDYFWRGSGLFNCLIDSVVFGKVDMARDSDESDLGADWVKGMKS